MAPTPLTDPRKPKCARCRHHCIIIPKKGHAKFCPFLRCECWKCDLITQRTRVTTDQRKLTKVRKAGRTEQRPGHGGVKPAAEGTSGGRLPAGGADPWDTSGEVCPVDLRSHRPDPGEEPEAGLESRDDPPGASNSPCFAELGTAFPLPLPHFPFRMSSHFPGGFAPPPHVLLHLPYLPPVPAGLYDGLCGPLLFPPLQQGGLHYLPPSEASPAADCRPVFFTHPPPPPPESSSGGADGEASPFDSSGHKC